MIGFKKELAEAREEAERWFKACERKEFECRRAIEARDKVLKMNEELANKNAELEERVYSLRTKYADEVQKRMELLELVLTILEGKVDIK